MGARWETDEELVPTSMPAGVTDGIWGWQGCWGWGGVFGGFQMKDGGTGPYLASCLAPEVGPGVTSGCQSGPLLLLLSAFLAFLGGFQLDWVWGGGQSLGMWPGSE